MVGGLRACTRPASAAGRDAVHGQPLRYWGHLIDRWTTCACRVIPGYTPGKAGAFIFRQHHLHEARYQPQAPTLKLVDSVPHSGQQTPRNVMDRKVSTTQNFYLQHGHVQWKATPVPPSYPLTGEKENVAHVHSRGSSDIEPPSQ